MRSPASFAPHPADRAARAGPAAACAPAKPVREDEQFSVQSKVVVSRQISAQLIDARSEIVLFAEKHVWVLRDRWMNLNFNVFLQDQRHQTLCRC